ncbi:MAG: SDR family NAD(P)-dependent oxidoreductase, partial [Alphaproteobacteria bacterium]
KGCEVEATGIAGKRVLVTGASRGIGYEVAKGFAEAGADVWILAETDDALTAAGRLAHASGRNVAGLVADVTDQTQIRQAVGAMPVLDVLVHNAGIEYLTPVLDPSPEVDATFRRIIEVNLIGAWHVARAAVGRMTAGGRIIFTASGWSKTAEAEFGGYVASKHGVLGLTRAMARELGTKGITVNAVCPGWVRTELAMRSLRTMAAKQGRAEADVLREILAAQSIPKLLEPHEVVGAYLFLASDLAADVTGQGLNVDRGWVMS